MPAVDNRALFITKLDSIEMDSCLEETHMLSNTVTDHPVEQGYNISDHSRPDPDRVTLRCFVSNTPLSIQQVQRAVRQGSVDFTTSSSEDARLSVKGLAGRGQDVFESLNQIRLDGTLIEVVTTLKTYGVSDTEGLIIESLSIPRTRDNYDGLEFTVTLKQIRIVKNKTTRQKQKIKKTRKKKKEGAKTTEEPKRKVTALKSLYRAAGGAR